MITSISGKLSNITENTAVVRINGVSYEVLIPSGLSTQIRNTKQTGDDIEFYTLYYIEAGAGLGNQYPRLVGFFEPQDRSFFELLTTVPGFGVKKALKSLIIPIRDIAMAIETEQSKVLTNLPGIGPRMAEKIIAELKGKTYLYALMKETEPLSIKKEKDVDFKKEVLEALMQAQYKQREAERIIEKAVATGKKFKSPEEMLQAIFQQQFAG